MISVTDLNRLDGLYAPRLCRASVSTIHIMGGLIVFPLIPSALRYRLDEHPRVRFSFPDQGPQYQDYLQVYLSFLRAFLIGSSVADIVTSEIGPVISYQVEIKVLISPKRNALPNRFSDEGGKLNLLTRRASTNSIGATYIFPCGSLGSLAGSPVSMLKWAARIRAKREYARDIGPILYV